MGGEVANKFEMPAEPGVGQHAPRVAAHRKHLAALDEMMPVEREGIGLFGDAALVDHRLAVILASRLEPVELEQPVGGREEFRRAELLFDRLIGDADRLAGHEPRIEEARLLGDRQEVVPIKRAAEAFAIKHGIGPDAVGQAPVAIDVGEIELATRLEQPMRAAKHRWLIHRKVDHAI